MSTLETGPLGTFFARYRDFEYNPAESATAEFNRLCDSYGWYKKKEKKKPKQDFQDALTMQFNDNYGTDVDDLTKWQVLCAKLGMDPVPESLKKCQEAVRRTHVNLVDLVDIFGTRKTARIFPTVLALSKYTRENKKFFPRDNAYAGTLLRFLLRQILNPELSQNEGRRGGRGGRGGGRRGRRTQI